MTLYPIKPAQDDRPLHYTWAGWEVLIGFLKDCGIELTEFKRVDEGDPISAETCFKVANTIDFHWDELIGNRIWLRNHVQEWRLLAEAGGCRKR
jgi:hypothetical protein